MNRKNKIMLEAKRSFSKSMFWQGQRQFYDQHGIAAWTGEVPFYITSNPFIGNVYATCIIRFIQDLVRRNPATKKMPFYIVELGAGSGQFSFYVLKSLQQLISTLKLDKLNICYIMTDFTASNIAFWQQHECLQPYITQKLVDFALFDLEHDNEFTTINQSISLSPGVNINPLVVIANYLFDSIVNDIFEMRKKKCYETLVSLHTSTHNLKNDIPKNWKQVELKTHAKKITDKHYNSPHFDSILKSLTADLADTFLLFPIGTLKGINALNEISNNKLLLLSSDKGFGKIDELENNAFPELDFHGSFSVMVNYPAIAEYFIQSNGDALIQSSRDGLLSCAGVGACAYASCYQ